MECLIDLVTVHVIEAVFYYYYFSSVMNYTNTDSTPAIGRRHLWCCNLKHHKHQMVATPIARYVVLYPLVMLKHRVEAIGFVSVLE